MNAFDVESEASPLPVGVCYRGDLRERNLGPLSTIIEFDRTIANYDHL